MERTFTYLITNEQAGQTVEAFLRALGYSKGILIHLRRTPMGISIGGSQVYTTHRLEEGELLSIRLREETTSPHIVPTAMELSIVYEDQDLMVIDKPADTPIHPSQGNFDNTLANGIAWYFQQKNQPFVYRAVNRLDRDTTGLLIIAKHMLSAALLSSMVKERQIKRTYLAIAQGKIPEEGTITAPIGRVDGSTIERQVDPVNGDPACTHFKRLLYQPETDCSLVRLQLETGRTHQIRVHFKSIGHPLPGDFLYHPDYRLISRQALHSFRLEFTHPITGIPMKLEAPLPRDMRFILDDTARAGHVRWADADPWGNDS